MLFANSGFEAISALYEGQLSSALRYYLAHCSAFISTFTAVQLNDSEASVGSDDDEVSPQSMLLAALSWHPGSTRALDARATTRASLAPPARNIASFGYILQLWL